MLTTILFTILFIFIWKYLKDTINYFKTGDKKENNQNYWMFSYDFKDSNDYGNYWQKDVQIINEKKRIRNKLIFLLYVNTFILFLLINNLVARIMILIFN
ncbi:MAG: hypothetical protein CMI79_04430 [Candidatus Pelagibacter sp.]|nr:hypothetical protein [Candidatus Pelagibacter sp.]|tara:strand:- start:1232 stop:1531 length:300 start_codon:yes stop_codon:yes gene_type:complete